MFLVDCQPDYSQSDVIFVKSPCNFQYVAMHTNPPLSLQVSEDYIIEILNATIDEETQLEFAKSYFALPVPLKSPIPLKIEPLSSKIEESNNKSKPASKQ